MLPSREIMQLENDRFGMNSRSQASSNKSQGQEMSLSNNNISQANNLVPSIGHLSVSSNSNAPNTMQSNSSVYNGFYSSSTYNSINSFEASLQWLTESRMPNNTLLSDKNLNCNSHTTPSHSCCVNRLGTVDNVGMCSPLSSGDSYRSNRDSVSYQTKPPALSVNVLDSVQNWFNLPPLPNQPYNNKFNDQNLNCSQMNFPVDQNADLKQSDICLQIPDSYFEQSLNSSNCNSAKQMNGSDLNANKIPDVNDIPTNKINSYQPNLMSREWKQPLQGANYISSPTLFGSLGDSPDHYLYSIPPTVTTSSYCMVTDNAGTMPGKLQQNCGLQQNVDKHSSVNNSRSLQCMEQVNHNKVNNQIQLYHQNLSDLRSEKSIFEKSLQLDQINENLKMNHHTGIGSPQHCSQGNMKNSSRGIGMGLIGKYNSETHFSTRYIEENSNSDANLLTGTNNNDGLEQKLTGVSKSNSATEINDEMTTCSEESNIIVEESDETEEIESIISIDEMKKKFLTEEPVELRCLVCNVKSSLQTPATHFIHMNDSFPLTSASKTPVASKLIQILPTDLQHFLKLHNSFMCRRCLNLIETVEVLEVKLVSVKQTLSENFSKTIQYFLPATPILEIENGKAKIIDKEIIPCIEKSVEMESSFMNDGNLTVTTKNQKDPTEHIIEIELDEIEESEDDVFDKELDDDECSVDDKEIDFNNGDLENVEMNDKENTGEENCSIVGKQCSICSKTLLSLRTYRDHMELHTKCYSFYCEYCGKGFNVKPSLEKHIQSHTNDNKYQCEKCGKTYSQKHRLEDHLKKHLGRFKMNCSECGKGFMRNRSLNIHMRSHTKEQPYVCEICGSRFINESNLKNHLQRCKKEEINCSLCSEVFYSKTQLKKHEVVNHGVKPCTECNVCGKTFVNVKDLKPHMRSHSQDKPFECKVCGKRYKSVGNLNHHSKIHDGNKLFNCTVCGGGFRRKKLLEDHMNKHYGERPYKCRDCGKGFFEQVYLQKHIKIHSGDSKTKTCLVCGKNFVSGLEVHMRTHTGMKPYVCTHCGQAFTVNSGLTRHIQSKHPNALET